MQRTRTLLFALSLLAACGSSGAPQFTDPAEPEFAVALFGATSAIVNNPYFPLRPGNTWTYQVETDEGVETIVVEVQESTREVAGVVCAIVRDRVFLDGLLIEDTHDWYAQDLDGNVWYMGEQVVNYEYDDEENVIATDDEGAWETGVDGALAGILMKATLIPGDSYRQEFLVGEAEDMGAIVALDVLVLLADGSSHICLQTRDWNPLEPDEPHEFKYYAHGIGLVVEETVDGEERAELLGIFVTSEASLPDFDDATFSAPSDIDHGLLAYVPGTTREFAVDTEDGTETILVEPLADTRTVNGVVCRVVRDRVWLDGDLIEDTYDWYAQDDDGNVWYMGEDSTSFEYDDDGNLIETSTDGSWEAGVDGAVAGILMWASPAPGASYYQEFYEDEAEDMAIVIATGVTVELEDGTEFENCVQILEWSPLEPDTLEYKYFAPGIGVVVEEKTDGEERVEIVLNP